MSQSIVAIAGFTGRLAGLIAKSLLKNHPDIKIHGIARALNKVDSALKQSSQVALFEAAAHDTAALRHALKGASVCICCYLSDYTHFMVEGQKDLIDACIEENVPRYIASDWSLDYRGLKFGEHPLKDPMKHVQVYLEEKERHNQIKAVHVLNGAFMDIILAPFAGFMDAKNGAFKYWGSGNESMDLTTYADAAAFTAEVAADPTAVGFLNVLGSRITTTQIAEAYRKVHGQDLRLENLGSLEELKANLEAAREQHPNNPYKWIGMIYIHHMLGGTTTLGPLDNERYPNFKAKSVEDYFREKKTTS